MNESAKCGPGWGSLLLGLVLVVAWPTQAGANGLNLSWDACGHAGLANKAFACNTNVGEEKLVLSGQFPMAGFPPELCYVADLDITSGQSTLPSWWTLGGEGACRPAALSMTVHPELDELAGCQWTNPSFERITMLWSTTGVSPLRRRLTIAGVPIGSAGVGDYVDPAETWVGTLRISHAKTTGAGSCSGCTTPMCIVFNSLQVCLPYPPNELHAYVNTPLERNFVTWQGGATGMAICPAATPARSRTWGALKSLYP